MSFLCIRLHKRSTQSSLPNCTCWLVPDSELDYTRTFLICAGNQKSPSRHTHTPSQPSVLHFAHFGRIVISKLDWTGMFLFSRRESGICWRTTSWRTTQWRSPSSSTARDTSTGRVGGSFWTAGRWRGCVSVCVCGERERKSGRVGKWDCVVCCVCTCVCAMTCGGISSDGEDAPNFS